MLPYAQQATQRTYPHHTHARYVTHLSAYSIEVAVEEAMLEVDSSEAIEEALAIIART